MDLYANEWQTFWRVTFPLVLPGILAAALLAFSLSFDDFIITNFNAGNTITFPMFVWGVRAARHPAAGQRDRHADVLGRADRSCWSAQARHRRPEAAAGLTRPGRRAAAARRWSTRGTRRTGWTTRAARRRAGRSPGTATADLVVVGGGYTGLWTALLAKERDPGRRRGAARGAAPCGWAASGRNGGFCVGQPHPRLRQRPGPLARRAGRRSSGSGAENLDGIEATVAALRHRLRLRAHRRARPSPPRRTQVDELREAGRRCGAQVGARLRAARRATRCAPRSTRRPTSAALLDRDGAAHGRPGPAGLGPARGLPRGSASGSTRTRRSPALDARRRRRCALRTPYGRVDARGRVALGTNAFPPLLRRLRPYTGAGLRLRADDRAADRRAARGRRLGATGRARRRRQPVPLLPAHRRRRILWGGYDAVYHFGSRTDDRLERNPATFLRLAEHFFATFPQLEGLRFTHALGRRDRHLHPVLRVLRHGARRPRSATPPATPASASAPPGSAPRCCSTCSTGADTERTALEMVREQAAAVPAGAAALGRRPADPPRRRDAPTPTAAGAARGCAPSTPGPRLRLVTEPHDQVRRRCSARTSPSSASTGATSTTRRSFAGADVVVVGAPFDGGTSHRPGTRFGPQAIRSTDYLPHDGSRPHLALRVDALRDLRVRRRRRRRDAAGDIERSLAALDEAVAAVATSGAIPVVLGGDHSITLAGRHRRRPAARRRAGCRCSTSTRTPTPATSSSARSTATASRCAG